MAYLYILTTIASAWFAWNFFSLLLNYQAACTLALPIVISPVNALNPFWMLILKCFPGLPKTLQTLPLGLGKWARYTYIGWTFHDKYAAHDELDLVFILVTPGGNELWVGDPDVAHTVLAKRKEYHKPTEMYKPLDVFGPSLNTVEGDAWQRHRRLTAPTFNEKISSSVWTEAMLQCRDMLHNWVAEGSQGTRDTVQDTARLALHVLSGPGFGIPRSFNEGVQKLPPGHAMPYQDALSIILRNVVTLAIFRKEILTSSLFPKKLRGVGQAAKEFKLYMKQMLDDERNVMRDSGDSNLLSTLVRVSDEAEKSGGGRSSDFGLSDEEIYGNIFIYNLAGHETTANTVAAAIVLLAAFPKCQDWLAEEIDQVLDKQKGLVEQGYESAFPELKRCLAVMYETLRLYGSIIFIPKTTGIHAQNLPIGPKNHLLPSGTAININCQAIHCNPRFWGHDALEWRPSRWIAPDETLIGPPKGQFIP